MSNSPKDSLMVKQISFIVVVRRIRTLGIAITVGIAAIYLMGLLVISDKINEGMYILNLSSIIILAASIPLISLIRKMLLKKVNLSNFQTSYFNAHIIPFAILDFTALFCITTNLFVNPNFLFATIGVVISVAAMILLLPKEEFFEVIKSRQ
ncbi:MAG TPA: hypothetical protein PKA90_14870 [Ignavibacteria bacterium]|nr:hypothetical protein [Ignavibacteria bacterium]